ncbi:cytochrome C oxidase subunit IV family protein [Falsibacillus pallidus]|uniref:Cytochrome c oxidase subunit 4 n=1 Tax=Falsibacillus pallidus TaxID=493781 RepID=A0A370GGD3_9BACI|nr:cytochrome C oxidase subunit IV family protein [Falsibacillus pallidus]RDI41023.1 cytochrome c oxidase subunit 4 [Falsibacillus pallidus]
MEGGKRTKVTYYVSFALMILFTAIAFYLVMDWRLQLGPVVLKWILIGMAVVQVFLQLFIFMHAGKGQKMYRMIALASGGMVAALAILFLWLLN